jgi:hypothetical protein
LQAEIAADPGYPLRGVTVFGLGHHEQTPDRINELNAFHRTRGREIRVFEKQLPHDGYINAKVDLADQETQWIAHPLTLHGSHLSGTIGNKTILGVTLECTLGYGFANTRNLFQRFANGAMDAVDIQMHEADAEFFASDDRTPAERAYIARR